MPVATPDASAIVLGIERSHVFAWDYLSPLPGDPALGLEQEGWLGDLAEPRPGWIYDHVPKAGGTHFSLECQDRLHPREHLWVRWPGTWSGILLGRLARATIVHGHGARRARDLLPAKALRTALPLREPMLAAVSTYQQRQRAAHLRGLEVPSLPEWLDAIGDRPGYPRDLNVQTRWLAFDIETPNEVRSRAELDQAAMTRALARVDAADVIVTAQSGARLFELMTREAALPIGPRVMRPPTNASSVPSRQLLLELPATSVARLSALTALDAELYGRAQSSSAWMS